MQKREQERNEKRKRKQEERLRRLEEKRKMLGQGKLKLSVMSSESSDLSLSSCDIQSNSCSMFHNQRGDNPADEQDNDNDKNNPLLVKPKCPFSIDSILETPKVPRGRRPNSKYPRVQACKSLGPLGIGMMPLYPITQPIGFVVEQMPEEEDEEDDYVSVGECDISTKENVRKNEDNSGLESVDKKESKEQPTESCSEHSTDMPLKQSAELPVDQSKEESRDQSNELYRDKCFEESCSNDVDVITHNISDNS